METRSKPGGWYFEPVFWDSAGNAVEMEMLEIGVQDNDDWRVVGLAAVHELVEALLCKAHGLTAEQPHEAEHAVAVGIANLLRDERAVGASKE